MAYINLLAVDPGGTTGWAFLHDGEFSSGEESDWLFWLCNGHSPFEHVIHHVAIEKYTITAKTAKLSQQTDALRCTGAIEAEAWTFSQVHWQTPAEAKSFSTDFKLKRIGWYRPGMGHANDAARHLLLLCVRRGLVDPAIFLEE